MGKLSTYLKETKRELSKVNWPTPRETARLTVVVVIFSIGIAAFLGLLDVFFQYILKTFII